MGYLSVSALTALGFAHLGRDVMISDKASVYDAHQISIGDRSRIDDFVVLSGRIVIGRNVHIAVFCNLAGGSAGITMGDFSGLAYGCHLIAQSDDYSGHTMTNPTVPDRYKHEASEAVVLGNHVILGTNSIVLPGVELGEGVSSGAGTLFTRSAEPWSVYVGSPARRIRSRSKELLDLAARYLSEPDDL